MESIDVKKEKMLEECRLLGVEANASIRWEKGMPHHPKSKEYMRNLMDSDWNFLNDYFCWEVGGDGDKGETLMYGLDILFELEDKRENKDDNQVQ